MKNLTSLLLLLCALLGVQCTSKQATPASVHLKGQLIDMGSTLVPMRYDGAAAMLGDSRDVFIETDQQGFFDITLPLTEPTYYTICRNTLYLTPGDSMTIKITQNNREATFEGKGAEVNQYMRFRLFPKGGSFLEGGDNLRKDFESTRTLIDSLAAVRRAQLEALKEASPEFKRLEEARIKADVVNSYLCYPSYYSGVYRVSREEMGRLFADFDRQAGALAAPLVRELNDDAFLNVAVVRDVFASLRNPKYAGWTGGIEWTPRTNELFETEGYVERLRQQVTPSELDEMGQYAATLKNADFATELKKKIEEAERLLPGKPAFDLDLTDTEGNPHKLSDLKGKLLYIDLWATWCGPCIAESPHFEALSKEFAGKEILFVPISTDNQRRSWLSYLEQHQKELTQYNSTDPRLSTDWKVYGIPRFILIDKDFNIINAYAPRPSEEGTKALLESLLKQ